MSRFSSTTVDANKGDSIRIIATGVPESGTTVFLMTSQQFANLQHLFHAGEPNAVFDFTASKKLSNTITEWVVTAPESDEWHIVFYPWEVTEIAVDIA